MLRARAKSMKRRGAVAAKPELRKAGRVGGLQSHLKEGGLPMRSLLTVAAFGILAAASSSMPGSAQQAADCGKYGMTCAPMAKEPKYTTGTQAKDCGLYGMSCAKAAAPAATTASAAPAALTPRAGITTGRSVARTRVSTWREARVRTAAAVPAATATTVAPATTTTVQAGYGYQPQYWGYGYGYYQPAPLATPVVTGRSVSVTTAAPAPAVVTAPVVAPAYYPGWYAPQPYAWGYYAPAQPWPWFW
jgi:hypothetical protein